MGDGDGRWRRSKGSEQTHCRVEAVASCSAIPTYEIPVLGGSGQAGYGDGRGGTRCDRSSRSRRSSDTRCGKGNRRPVFNDVVARSSRPSDVRGIIRDQGRGRKGQVRWDQSMKSLALALRPPAIERSEPAWPVLACAGRVGEPATAEGFNSGATSLFAGRIEDQVDLIDRPHIHILRVRHH